MESKSFEVTVTAKVTMRVAAVNRLDAQLVAATNLKNAVRAEKSVEDVVLDKMKVKEE